jgi:hypothetical protein
MALQNITGLWKTKSGNGLSGKVRDEIVIPAGARVVVLKNERREPDSNQPEYNLKIAVDGDEQPQPRQQRQSESEGSPF